MRAVGTHADARLPFLRGLSEMYTRTSIPEHWHECQCGTQECVRHIPHLARQAFPDAGKISFVFLRGVRIPAINAQHRFPIQPMGGHSQKDLTSLAWG
jgi:hypothetical protein